MSMVQQIIRKESTSGQNFMTLLAILDLWCIGGDFNVIRWFLERSSGGRISKAIKKFNSIIGELELMEVPLSNGKFTWS